MKNKKISKRITLGVVFGSIAMLLLVFLITRIVGYLKYSNLTISVVFKPGIDQSEAQAVLLKYGEELKAEYIRGNEQDGYILINEISPRIKGYLYEKKIKAGNDIEIKGLESHNSPYLYDEVF